jgi:hypothetical protein
MEIAEEVIADAIRKHPKLKPTLNDMFQFMCPPVSLRGVEEAVYRVHVTELLNRVTDKYARAQCIDLDLATSPELMMALHEQSLRAPMTRKYANAYYLAFDRVFPDRSAKAGARFEFDHLQSWEQTQAHETLREMSREFAVPDRRIKLAVLPKSEDLFG